MVNVTKIDPGSITTSVLWLSRGQVDCCFVIAMGDLDLSNRSCLELLISLHEFCCSAVDKDTVTGALFMDFDENNRLFINAFLLE